MRTSKEIRLPDQDTARKAIAVILKAVKEEENPEELNSFRALVKSNVPIFMRSYFAAYLFKKSLESFADQPSELTKLFVSVGKNRRVFPKDLTKLFISRLNIKRSDIGDVKVLDNYSFININLDHAQKAISEMSGTNFRGRRITVNLARKKGEEGE